MDQIMQLGGVGIGGTILIGILAGWLAEKFTGSDHGLIMNLIIGLVGSWIGFVGAVVGNFLLGLVGIGLGGLIGQLIVAVIGACVLILVYRAVKGRA